jgi:hypothetical protein
MKGTKLKFISRNFVAIKTEFSLTFVVVVVIVVQFDLKRDPDLVHKIELFSNAPYYLYHICCVLRDFAIFVCEILAKFREIQK